MDLAAAVQVWPQGCHREFAEGLGLGWLLDREYDEGNRETDVRVTEQQGEER